MNSVWVIGNGGHAKVAIDALRLQGRWQVAGVVSDSPDEPPCVPGISHIGPIEPDTLHRHGVERALIGIGSNSVRARIVALLDGTVEWVSAIHPSAVVSPSARIGAGALISAGAIVQPDAVIGDHGIVNTGASVDHDCEVGRYAHIAPGARLAGNVTVGEGAFVGVGSQVIPARRIGAWSVVGAGAAVVEDVPDNVTAVGVPARVIKRHGDVETG